MNQQETRKVSYIEASDSAAMAAIPVVSVLMITYNHGPYLAEAIEGVIAQRTDFPVELVIGEDCSTDNTREIALDYQRRYPHLIRLIYSDHNVGMHENERRTLKACRGEFVAFCEGDDYWIDPDKLTEQVNILSRFKQIDLAFHGCYFKYEKQGKKVLSADWAPNDKVFSLPEIIAGSGDFMPSASVLIRRSLLISVQDWLDAAMPPVTDYFLQVFGSRRGGAYYINKPMSVYRREVAVSWSAATEKTIDAVIEFEKSFFLALKKLEDEIPDQGEAVRQQISCHYSRRLTISTKENFTKIKELILPILKHLYQSEDIGNNIGNEQLERSFFIKLATDGGKAKELADRECGVFWQSFRVMGSAFDYGILLLKMININYSDSNDDEKLIDECKVAEKNSYLIARSKRLYRLSSKKCRIIHKRLAKSTPVQVTDGNG